MDTINHFRSSIAQTFMTFERDLDSAYEELNAELARYDERVRRAEEHARTAEKAQILASAEVEKLKSELALLRETPHQDVVSSDYIEKSLQLEETYSPRHVLELNDGNKLDNLEPNDQQWKVITLKYKSLYNDAQTLVSASGKFREQIRRQKQKLVDWQKCLHRNEFTLTLDGTPVTFKKVQNCDQNLLAKAEVCLAVAAPTPHKYESVTNVSTQSSSTRCSGLTDVKALSTAQNEYESTKRLEQPHYTETDDLASTQSASSPIDEGPATERRIHDEPLQRGTQALKRKPTDSHHTSRALDGREDPDHAPIVIKSEGISPSSLQTFSEGPGTIGTQDLDEVGDTVETPTKKKARSSNRHQRSSLDQRTTTPSKWSNILQPVNSNIRPVTGWRLAKSSTKSPRKGQRSAISSIAEDGDENHLDFFTKKQPTNSTSEPGTQHATPGVGSDSTQHRLLDLLDQPFSRRQPLLSQNKSSIHTNAQNDPAKARDVASFSTKRPTSHSTAASRTQKPYDQDEEQPLKSAESAHRTGLKHSAACSNNERYRSRPLHRLELDHFKINPDYNQGMDFAFNEVVRKKNERKCLSGCMRPGCCGDKFLAMARIGAEMCSPAEERTILEEYMGNDKHLLDGLSKKDRENLLHEAKAKSLADTIGKHRHHHQRPSTPPGFWRTEMPDTQELEHDREEAKLREREKVRDRHREAMRSGGLWKFADE